jgi:hypothetical protein
MNELPHNERPISEQYRIVAKLWANAESAAHLLEETKTTTLEEKKCALIAANPSLAENKAERLAKADPEWREFIEEMCAARAKANFLKVKLEYIRMRHREWIGANADARAEMRLGGGDP